jgi:hypothetical protein
VTKWGTEEATNFACHHRFKSCIETYNPDLVISVHPLCQDIPIRVLTNLGHGRWERKSATCGGGVGRMRKWDEGRRHDGSCGRVMGHGCLNGCGPVGQQAPVSVRDVGDVYMI